MKPEKTVRHLSRAAVEEYLSMTAPASLVVPGEPLCRIVIDPPRMSMVLRTPGRGGHIDLADFENVEARVVSENGIAWSELTVDYRDHGHEAYLLLSDVADMIQENRLSFDAAVRSALMTFEDLLTRAGSLSPERQTGLYGELLFMESCLSQLPVDAAVAAWKGFGSHEHDFVFAGSAFEIKTTRTEKRRHHISGLEQLQPTPGHVLWLVSVQLTPADGATGRTLAELVDDVAASAGPARPKLETALARAGWRDRDRPRYREPLTRRTIPAAYAVDQRFPVLSCHVIDQSCSRPELIVDASYTIDVTSLARQLPPAPGARFVEGDT